MVQIRKILKADLEKLQQFWNRNVIYDRVSIDLLKEKIFDDMDYQPELTLIAEQDEQILSFVMGLVRQRGDTRIGWIKLFATDKKHRRQGLATELLNRIEKQLKNQKVSRIQMIDSTPNYLQPGIDPFYTEAVVFVERRGYKKIGDTSNLSVDLVNQDFDTSDEEKSLALRNIIIRRALPADRDATMNLLSQFFPAWIPEVAQTFKNQPISLHVALVRGGVEAFSAYDANNFNTGWFGPMGTNPQKRGLGVGGVLLKRCLQDMKNQGHKVSIVPWVGPIPFYLHYANAKVDRVFWRYAKEVAPTE